MSQLQEKYRKDVVPALMKAQGYANVMQVPRLTKVVLNIGVGEAITNAKAIDAADEASKQESLAAEKCLLYVALTRAQKAAFITSYGKQSEFLPKT